MELMGQVLKVRPEQSAERTDPLSRVTWVRQPALFRVNQSPRNFRCTTVRALVAIKYRSASAVSSPPRLLLTVL
jgi:hypothetical protein